MAEMLAFEDSDYRVANLQLFSAHNALNLRFMCHHEE